MLEITQVFIFFLIQQIVIVAFSLIRAKLQAEFCGVECFGLLSQAGTLVLTLQVIFGAGLGSGFIKLVAQYHKANDSFRLNQTLSAMFYSGMLMISVGFLVTTFLAEPISSWVFGSTSYRPFVIICAITTFFIYQSVLFLNLFSGLLEWKLYTITSIIGYLLNIVVTAVLVIQLKVEGGVLALLAGQVLNSITAFVVFRIYIKKRYPIAFFRCQPDWSVVRTIFTNIGPLVVMQMIYSFSLLVVRSMVIHQLGQTQNGLYQVAGGLSDTYTGLIFGILMAYVLPKITAAAVKDPALAHQTQNDGIRLSIFAIGPLLIAMLGLREIWIPILYNRSFLAAQELLVWQFMGDFLLIMRRCFNVDLIPNNRWAYFLLDGLLYAAAIIVFNILLLPVLGLFSVPISILTANLLLVLASYIYHQKRTNFRIRSENQALILKSAIFLGAGFAIAMYLPDLALRIPIIVSLIAAMALVLPHKGELSLLFRELLPAVLKPRSILTDGPKK